MEGIGVKASIHGSSIPGLTGQTNFILDLLAMGRSGRCSAGHPASLNIRSWAVGGSTCSSLWKARLPSGAARISPRGSSPSFSGEFASITHHHSGVWWCSIKEKRTMRSYRRPSAANDQPASIRASVTFPAEIYQALEEIARQKRVSLAWVVRDAAERYVSQEQEEHPSA